MTFIKEKNMSYVVKDGNHRQSIVKDNGEVIQLRSHTNRKDVVFAGLKKEFNIPLTKSLCPPIDFYIGCKFIKRIVVKIEDIFYEDPETKESLQSREQINVVDNVTELTTSLRYRGWLHDEQPLFVQQVKGKSKLFFLRSGFNRITAAIELQWKYIIVDVYEDAEEPEDQILFKYVVNNDNTPSRQNRDVDFVKGTVEAIDTQGLTTDEEIVAFLKKITCTSDGIALRTPSEIEDYEASSFEEDENGEIVVVPGSLKRSCLLYKVRRKRGKEAHIRPLDGNGANAILKRLKRGYHGASLITTQEGSELGYAFEEKNSLHRIFWDGIKLYSKYTKPIMCFGYIENPSSVTLEADRTSCKEHFNEFIEEAKKKIYPTIDFDKLGVNTMNDVPWNIEEIFKWGGFIPQDETMVNSKIKEEDIVV
jgi:hypothetical protein